MLTCCQLNTKINENAIQEIEFENVVCEITAIFRALVEGLIHLYIQINLNEE